jgi:hypothetical protein
VSCRPTVRRSRRIEEAVARPLIEKFYRDEQVGDVAVDARPGDAVCLCLGTESTELSRAQVRQLREALGEALTERTAFAHTAGEHREDGSYVVERRGAESSGHRKVFDSFEACRETYEALSREFTAEDVERAGLTGGRRHMLVWHFVEHPAFDCTLAARQPLTASKSTVATGESTTEVVGD